MGVKALKHGLKTAIKFNGLDVSSLNPKLLMEFERYLEGNAFQKKIIDARLELNFPREGYEDWEKYFFDKYLNNGSMVQAAERNNNLKIKVGEIAKSHHIPSYLVDLVEAYLIMGNRYRRYDLYFDDFGCRVISYDNDKIIVEIHARAKLLDVISFFKKNWKRISRSFTFWGPNPEVKQIRIRRNEARDKKIYEYYKAGLIRSSGLSNVQNLRKIDPELRTIKDYDPSLKGLDYENIKKIIQIQRNRRR
ncbi:MAG: hypothetical protein HY978_03310 [Candidatus Liptonbacteria bacterium]|nr:hypothetical protein [Candidatus Liptonbacteria bacterium]